MLGINVFTISLIIRPLDCTGISHDLPKQFGLIVPIFISCKSLCRKIEGILQSKAFYTLNKLEFEYESNEQRKLCTSIPFPPAGLQEV